MGIQEDWDAASPDLQQEWDNAAPKKTKEQGWADSLDPTLRKTLQIGVPTLAAIGGELAMAPFTGGMSLVPAMGLTLAAAGVGGLGGEAVNQATGISEPSTEDQMMAFLSPVLGSTVAGAAKGALRFIPGYGESLRAALAPEARNLPQEFLNKATGGKSVSQLYDEFGQVKGQIPRLTVFKNTEDTVKKLKFDSSNVPFDQMRKDLSADGSDALLDQVMGAIRGTAATTQKVAPTVSGKQGGIQTGLPKQTITTPGTPPGLAFDQVDASIKGFGRLIGRTSDDVRRGEYQQLYKSFLKDLEAAPMPAGGSKEAMEMWKQARKAAKLEHATFDLGKAIERSITEKDGVQVFNPNQVLKWMRTDKEFKSRLEPEEYRQIHNEVRMMASVAGHNMSKFTAMIIGGFMSGGAGGALAGYLGSEQLGRILMTEAGRKAVRATVSNPVKSTFRRAGAAMGATVGNYVSHLDEEDQ